MLANPLRGIMGTVELLSNASYAAAAIIQEDEDDEEIKNSSSALSRLQSPTGSASLSSAATSPASPCPPIRIAGPLLPSESPAEGADDHWPTFAESVEMLRADAEAQEPVIGLYCRVLQSTVAENDKRIEHQTAHGGTQRLAAHPLFEGAHPCPLSASEYVKRILKYTRCSACNLVVGLIYLQRLKDSDPDGKQTVLSSFNIQRLLLTALMLASKFLDEPHCSNKQWALVGDLSVKEMNSLEWEMLWRLKFSLNVSREEYDECFQALEALDV